MTTAANKIKKSRGDRVFSAVNYTVAALIILVMLYPMYFIVIASISSPTDVSAGNITFIPSDITFKGYAKLF